MKRSFLIAVFLIRTVFGQVAFNHPELVWKTFETDHFTVHFHNGTERTAKEGATAAEKIYPHVTGLYQYEPMEKTHIIFMDTDDYSNGAAYYFDNKIEIWASPLDMELRGSHRWLQNVITHEFTHIVSMQAAMKFGRSVPGGYFQWIRYEPEKREDVLYGYPNTLVSYPVPGTTVPPWFAEGVAQFMYEGATYDFWDTHRDMILRDRALNNNLLSLTEMNTFGKPGIGNESTYNSGFAFSRYLAYKYGQEVLPAIARNLSRKLGGSIQSAIEGASGFSAEKVFSDFQTTLMERYELLTESVKNKEVKGKIIWQKGTANFHPKWAPDGERFAFLSNVGNDFLGQTNLRIFTFTDSTDEVIAKDVFSTPAWSSSGEKIYYTKKSKPDGNGSKWFDLYVYSFEDEEEERLTKGARAFSPVIFPGDSLLAYLATRDGTQNVFLINLNSEESEQITRFDDGRQISNLTFDPNKRWLMFDYVESHFRNIATLNLTDTTFVDLMAVPEWDERDMTATANGGLIYSLDRSGIFNLFYVNSSDGRQGYISNVFGGAFMPDVSRDGKVLYSLYENGGYSIALVDSVRLVDESDVGYSPDYFTKFNGLPPPIMADDSSYPDSVSKNYEDSFSNMFFFPRLQIDYGMVKPGFYFQSNEVINRLSVFGGAGINRLTDLDLFLLFELRTLYPTLYAEIFFMTRHITNQSTLWDVIDIDSDVAYRLFQMEGGARFPLRGQHSVTLFGSYQNYRSNALWWVPGEQLFGKSGIDYYSGIHTGVRWDTQVSRRTVDYDILPSNGFKVHLDIRQENNRFYSPEASLFEIVFNNFNFTRVEGSGEAHFEIPYTNRWTFSAEMAGGWMSETEVDSFFNFFTGGMPGIRGYPFYALEGNRMVLVTTTARIPIMRQRHIPLGPFILQNIVTGFIGQFGDAWNGNGGSFSGKRSAGVQLRFSGFSFYNYPTGIAVELHRGLDKFTALNHEYGGDSRFYFTLLFGF